MSKPPPARLPTRTQDPYLQFLEQLEELKKYVVSCLLNIRRELENVLYACYLYHIKGKIDELIKYRPDNLDENLCVAIQLLLENKKLFLDPRICREISVICSQLSPPNFGLTYSETLQKILKPQYVVYLTKFADECLNSFIQTKGLYVLFNKMNNFLERKIIKDQLAEANHKRELLKSTLAELEEQEKINNVSIPTTPLRPEVDLISALDVILKKNVLKTLQANANKRGKKVDLNEEQGSNMVFLSDNLKDHTDNPNIPIPEVSLAHKLNFCSNYLERRIISETVQPSVLQVNFKDPDDSITCIEVGHNHNIIACGTIDAGIIIHLLNPVFLNQYENKANSMEEEESQGLPSFKLRGHEGAITSISILYDEYYMLSSSVDTTINYWCLRQKTLICSFKAHLNTVWKVRFSPKGYYFATGSSDTTAKLWTVDKLAPVRVFLGHASDVNVVEFVPNCLYLVTCGFDNKIIFWEIASGNRVKILYHFQEIVSSVCVSFSGLYMVTGSEEGSIIFWNLTKFMKKNYFYLEKESKKSTNLIIMKKYKINFVGFNVDESYLMVISKKKMAFYSVKNLKEKKNEDIYAGYLKDEIEEGEDDEIQPINFFDNKNAEIFWSGSFHEKNVALIISKSHL